MTRLIRRSSPRTGGVPLVIELFRRLGAAQVVNEQVRVGAFAGALVGARRATVFLSAIPAISDGAQL